MIQGARKTESKKGTMMEERTGGRPQGSKKVGKVTKGGNEKGRKKARKEERQKEWQKARQYEKKRKKGRKKGRTE